jgi:hypothetical protein
MSQPQDMKSGAASIQKPAAPPERKDEPAPVMEAPVTRTKFFVYTYERGMLIGNHFAQCGDVIEVTRDRFNSGSLAPVDDRLFENRAAFLISKGRGRWHNGPANVKVTRPTDDEVVEGYGFRTTASQVQAHAEKSLSPRGKAGAL